MHVCINKNRGLYDWYARWVPAWTLCNNKVGMSVSLPGSGASESASTRRRGVLPSNSANGSSLSRLFGHIVMRRHRFWFSRGKWFPGNRKMQDWNWTKTVANVKEKSEHPARRPPQFIIWGLLTRGNPGTVTISQYRVNKTKQHTVIYPSGYTPRGFTSIPGQEAK